MQGFANFYLQGLGPRVGHGYVAGVESRSGIANSGGTMSHCGGGDAARIQRRQPGYPGILAAYTGIVIDREGGIGLDGPRGIGADKTAVRAGNHDAARILAGDQGRGVQQHDFPPGACQDFHVARLLDRRHGLGGKIRPREFFGGAGNVFAGDDAQETRQRVDRAYPAAPQTIRGIADSAAKVRGRRRRDPRFGQGHDAGDPRVFQPHTGIVEDDRAQPGARGQISRIEAAVRPAHRDLAGHRGIGIGNRIEQDRRRLHRRRRLGRLDRIVNIEFYIRQ